MAVLANFKRHARSLAGKYLHRSATRGLGYDPYDQKSCEVLAEKLLEGFHLETALRPIDICQRLLVIAESSYPTERLADKYFANLETILSELPRLEAPGQLVIGLGPGRCGSSSLSAMLGSVANSCCTHETPPTISWSPRSEQVTFHLKRFAMLADRYALVSDVSHWWLNAIEDVFDRFPDAKAIGLIRNPDDCAGSFLQVQGLGRGTFNPWASPGNGLWRAGHWDATYPSYTAPDFANSDPDRAKLALITRYVTEYNSRLEVLARNEPSRVKLVRTEALSLDTVQAEIFAIAKAPGQISEWKLNAGSSITDGKQNQIKF